MEHMPFVIALCEDDAEQAEYIRKILCAWAAGRMLSVQVDVYACGEAFWFAYPDHPCDLLLLDIEMRKLSGMELARKLRSENNMLPILFITGFSEYMSEGYDVEALHYLLKPVDAEKLTSVLDKYISRKNVRQEEVLVKGKDATVHIAASCIVYIEAFGRKSRFTLSDASVIECEQNIGQFERLQGFLHCHRSYLVNLRYVKGIGRTFVSLDTGMEIPLSRRLYQEVNKRFIAYYRGGQDA